MEQGLLIVTTILQIGIGTYVLSRDTKARVNRLFAWCALSFTLGSFAALLQSVAVDQAVAANLVVLSTVVVSVWNATLIGLCVLAIFYPQAMERHRFWTLYLPTAIAGLATLAGLALYVGLPDKTSVLEPLGAGRQVFPVRAWGLGYIAVWVVVSLGLLVSVAVRQSGSERQSAVVLIALTLIAGVVGTLGAGSLPESLGIVGSALSSTLLFLGFGYVIIRFRLFATEAVARGLAFDSLQDGVLVLRGDQVVLSCNRSAAELLGLSMREIVHMRIDHVLAHSPLPGDVWHGLWSQLQQGEQTVSESRYDVGQTERVVVNELVPIHDVRQDVQGYVWLIRDVTELRRSQEQSEARNRELQAAISELRNTSEVQGRLLETVRTLSAPAVPIIEGIVVLPLSGQIDSERAERILDNLLEGIDTQQAKIAIIDITGVPVVDTAVAQYLIQAARAASLMGCRPFLVGIRPEIAQVIVELGIDMAGLTTFSDLQSGVEHALRVLGMELVHAVGASDRGWT